MKNILLLSPIYPGNGTPKGFTPVVHYFAKEWVKLGYNVRVIHTSAYFPFFFYLAPQWLRKIVENRAGISLPDKALNNEERYTLDDVKVYRLALKKCKPHGGISEKLLQQMCDRAFQYLNEENFKPDVIISHWINPVAYLMNRMKEKFQCTTCLILHGYDGKPFEIFRNGAEIKSSVDIWGYRSETIKKDFEKAEWKPSYSFRCYSGIPSSLLNEYPRRDWTRLENFIFVGQLIERKHPNLPVVVLNRLYGDYRFHLDIVGDGALRKDLEQLVTSLSCSSKVKLIGRVPREEVLKYLDSAQVFVMISHREVYGLAYLEAMARGCITIASRNEGMEGIIEDGVNGFLCNAGDSEDLSRVISRIRSLSVFELQKISENGRKTAMLLTDHNTAKDYIETVLTFSERIKTCQDSEALAAYHTML
jgi:glycosyltransferase involved in cell wall biosynthesis